MASVHLTEDSEPIDLAKGDFTIVRITEDNVSLATVVKVGLDLQWPLTKDEPVIKIDKLHYLFTLPGKDGSFLNYGVSFVGTSSMLDSLDLFLKEHACFSTSYIDGVKERVRKLSEMTEKMSQSLLNGVLLVSGSVTAPLVQSKAGKAFFSMLPGEVLLASPDAVGKVLDVVELTERKAFVATSGAVTGTA